MKTLSHRSPRLPLAALCAALGSAAPALAHDAADAANPGASLGQVHFKVDCNAAAQKEFDLATAYYHSFAWGQVGAPLERTLRADPGCGMAHWAAALSLLDNPFAWPGNVSAQALADGAALLGSVCAPRPGAAAAP